MFKTTPITLPKTATKIFSFSLSFYPEQYRKKFGQEMYILFCDMYEEEIAKYGRVGVRFWLSHTSDALQSIMKQHILLIGKLGFKKYVQQILHINSFTIVGGVLLLPIITMMGIDIISRIIQRDLVHYNRPVYSFLSHTPLYWYPILFTWAILFPLLAVLISIIPLLQSLTKRKTPVVPSSLIKKNLGSTLVLLIGLGFLLLLKLHDFAPCVMHGLLRLGFGQLPHIFSVCTNA